MAYTTHTAGRMTSIARASLRVGGKLLRGSLRAGGMGACASSKYSCVSRGKLGLLMRLFELTMSTWTMSVTSFPSYRGFGCCHYTTGINKIHCYVYCRSWLQYYLQLNNFYVSISVRQLPVHFSPVTTDPVSGQFVKTI